MPYNTKEKQRAYNKLRNARDRDKIRSYHKAWREKNDEHCRAYRKAYRGHRGAAHRAERYGLSVEQVAAMQAAQDHKCAICRQPPIGKDRMGILHIDHDHGTGAVRAMLCQRCNKGLGCFLDNESLLVKAAEYLAFHRKDAAA